MTPVRIALEDVVLHGNLHVPEHCLGMVLFSHGSGSSRWSPRNNYVAEKLHENGIGTLLFDLLTEREDSDYHMRFNINLLTIRLIKTTEWLLGHKEIQILPIGYFGASTGAASALMAAAHFGSRITSVVSRGGRPDLAIAQLTKVRAPTLLIVGELDRAVIEFNQQAYHALSCTKHLTIVPGATHLFEEPGKLAEVARLSAAWFTKWFTKLEGHEI